MRGADLRPGMKVAIGQHGAGLGDRDVRQGIVLGDRLFGGEVRPYYYDHVMEGYRPAARTSAYERRSGGYPVAARYVDSEDARWHPNLFSGREILGEWSDHEEAAAYLRQLREEREAKAEKAAELRGAWLQRHGEALRALGLEVAEDHWHSMALEGPGLEIDAVRQRVSLSAGALAHVLALAEDGLALRALHPSVWCRACASQSGCSDHNS